MIWVSDSGLEGCVWCDSATVLRFHWSNVCFVVQDAIETTDSSERVEQVGRGPGGIYVGQSVELSHDLEKVGGEEKMAARLIKLEYINKN